MSTITIIKKQLIAGFLVAMLLTITAVKFFHTCNEHAGYSEECGIEQISENIKCAICEFHFTKDLEMNIELPVVDTPLLNSRIVYPSYISLFQSSVGLSFSDRGPPSLL